MRVLFANTFYKLKGVPNRVSPVDYWRIINPAKALQRNTDWTVDIQDDLIQENEDPKKVFPEIGKNYDVVISNYHGNGASLAWMHYLNEHYGTKYAISIDDDITAVKEKNRGLEYYKKKPEQYANIITVLELAPNLITTNKYLKYRLELLNKNIHIFDNYIDKNIYIPQKKTKRDYVTIGYQGGSTHREDLLDSGFYTAIVRIIKKYDKRVRLRLFGQRVAELEALPRVIYTPGYQNYLEYVRKWQEWISNIDIGVAPLENKEFNLSKSDIKVQEYGIAGVPVITSKIATYANIITEKNGMMASDADEWEKCLTIMIEDKLARGKFGIEIKKTVDKLTSDKNYKKMVKVIENLV